MIDNVISFLFLQSARNIQIGGVYSPNCHRVQKNLNCPKWESNLGRRIQRQTLKAVEVCFIPIPTTYFPALN